MAGSFAARLAARMLSEAGHLAEALTWLEQRSDAGDRFAAAWAARMLAGVGRTPLIPISPSCPLPAR